MSVPDPISDLDFEATLPLLSANRTVFGRYVLRRQLGRGGMGVVWLAHDDTLGVEVALKFLPDAVARAKEALAELKRETLRSRELRHPGIVAVYEFVQDDRAAAIVMEFVDGETLSELKAEQPGGCFDVEKIAPWIKQLCEVLAYAHAEARVVHRDLKPRNLMLTRDGRLKVADFGISRSVNDSLPRVSVRSPTSGTPPYMSPQQGNGEPVSIADDIYAVGATIYDLLTGKPPFYSGNISRQVHEKIPPSMRKRRTELQSEDKDPIPATWETTVAACLDKNPATRPANALTLWQRLDTPTFNAPAVMPKAPAVIAKAPAAATVNERTPKAPVWHRAAAAMGVSALMLGKLLLWLARVMFRLGMAGLKKLIRWIASPDAAIRRRRTAAAIVVVVVMLASVGIWMAMHGRNGVGGKSALAQSAMPVSPPTAEATSHPLAVNRLPLDSLAAATKDKPFVNSLGMEFVPVPGTGVFFCRWETRVKDYEAFVEGGHHDMSQGEKMGSFRNGEWGEHGDTWHSPGYPQAATHPVVGVSWEDAQAFCSWLSQKEGREYRLPSDHEWSCAVGIGEREDAQASPKDKSRKIDDAFPWGAAWPPPKGAGNYADESARKAHSAWTVLDGYDDGFADTAPVGSFAANRFGIHDLGGNVLEWCADWDDSEQKFRVLRGCSFRNSERAVLLSSFRAGYQPSFRSSLLGFRVAVVGAPSVR